MQLDIFEENDATLLGNDLARALKKLDFDAADLIAEEIALAAPCHPLVAAAHTLSSIKDLPATIERHVTLGEWLDRTERQVVPAAEAALGEGASEWLRQNVWLPLAYASESLPYCEDYPQSHVAGIWVKAGEWQLAKTALRQIPGWRGHPQLLFWQILAVHAERGTDFIWPYLFELAWISPPLLFQAMKTIQDKALCRIYKRFCDAGEDWPTAFFPAFAIAHQPALVRLSLGCSTLNPSAGSLAFNHACILAIEKTPSPAAKEARAKLAEIDAPLFSACIRELGYA